VQFLTDLFIYLVFPGFLFVGFLGCLVAWFDRKLTARIHFRVGPPWYQTFADILKLLGKETIVPRQATPLVFLAAPLCALAAAVYAASVILAAYFRGALGLEFFSTSFSGDVFVVLYVLAIPSIAFIVGSYAAANPLASLGGSRETKLLMAYELPFLFVLATSLVKAQGSLKLEDLIAFQQQQGSFLLSPSGVIAFIVGIFCLQAKLAIVPFDIPEAETEIMGGTIIEYSGAPLALIKLARAILLVAAPAFLLTLFWTGADFFGLLFLAKLILLWVIIVLLKNVNPRVRVDQALRFFWGPVLGLAVLALWLAVSGY